MSVQTEDSAPSGRLLDAHKIKYERTTLEAVGQHVNRGIPPGHKSAIKPNEAIYFGSFLHGRECITLEH